jgi:hypothetical protein
MNRSDTRVSRSRWRALGRSAALGLAAMAVIGLSSITPAKADHDWHHHGGGVGFGFSIGAPGYGYYPYPAYPSYPAYPAYYYGGYPYYYGPAYGGPSFSVHVGGH